MLKSQKFLSIQNVSKGQLEWVCYHFNLQLAITRLINNTYTLFTFCAICIIIVKEKNIYERFEVPSTYMNQLSKVI